MSTPRDPQWFFDRAKSHLASARLLDANKGTVIMAEEVPAHLHSAIEMALKAALISRDFWDGCDDSFFIHDLRELAEELAGKGFPMPPDLLRYLRGASKIPRTGQRSCETHVQTEYADNLDWNRISLSDLFALAERTLEHVRNECGFS